MEKGEAVSSFVKGFGRENVSDIINAMYIARKVFEIDFPFNFESRGSRGVDSREIRKIVFFTDLRIFRNHKSICKAAEQLSKINSEKLGWLAQYMMNGKTHLYKQEADEASGVEKTLLCQV